MGGRLKGGGKGEGAEWSGVWRAAPLFLDRKRTTAQTNDKQRATKTPKQKTQRKQVALRNALYPYLIWAFYKEWRLEAAACGSPWNWILLTPVLQAFLTALNFKWSHELFSKLPQARRQAVASPSANAAAARGGGGGRGGGGDRYDKHL